MKIDPLQLLAGLHFLALGGVALYGIHRLWLLLGWFKYRGRVWPRRLIDPGAPDCPKVTIQLPLFNERYVAARLIDAAAAIDWPRERLEIQVLDDSTDETRAVVDERVAHWRARGIAIAAIRRECRTGFKAGALDVGMARAEGEYLAVFDADFVPTPDFLRRTMGCFDDPAVGMVQARWGYLNAEHSWLTRIQTLLLGAHFSMEQFVRFNRGQFFNFNGTAGIWRYSAIEEAGGWSADTVTEDLDLSYRAQLAGWRFVYLEDVVVPSELPVTLSAMRTQQQRWAKGSMQTARKTLAQVWRSDLPKEVKEEAFVHLLANLGWLCGAIATLTLLPTLIWRVGIGPWQMLRLDLPLFFGASVAIILFFAVYATGQRDRRGLAWLPLLPALAVGLSPSIAWAVLEGMWRHGGEFRRTPKLGLTGRVRTWWQVSGYSAVSLRYVGLHLALLAYLMGPVAFVYRTGFYYTLPMVLLFPGAFLLMVWQELGEWVHIAKTSRHPV